jgi:DNA-directed RNA polymerase
MINQINSTPFKINTVLLDYIMNNWERHNLLFDPKVKHKFEDIEKRTKYQNGVYNSHISKIILQETILGIAQFFSNFNEIYFPVRLDQRGRLYCSPNFMNYQANELSKALLIFSKPGIIKKDDMDGITYLKAYGANCYGNKISKSSTEAKLEWVNQNIDNILNYDNGVLLNKSKDKLLFLAFCIEYKRFYDFYTDENLMEFETYLPIQLDATCNGFQHMALLSNEDTLFKELNLVSNKSDKPNDFYNFLVHKLKDLFDKKILEGEFIDNKTNGSYERLSKFIWDRSYIKKAIMTIPYNSSVRSMRKYISDSLVKIDHDEDNSTWYSDSEKNTKIIINNKDIALLTLCLMNIIQNDFEKIKKLSKYLKNVATLLTILELPISWTLPTGLIIKQSYLETKSTTITPFTYSKIKLNLRLSIKDKYDKNKQVRALMPNLIHSLDGSSLSLLFNQFSNLYNKSSQFYSVHDCFGTTCDKVFILKTILASVYTDIYSSEPYLYNFDKDILDNIEKKTNYKLDRKNRTLEFLNTTYTIHDIDWVTNKKQLSNKIIKAIDSQYILI